MRHKRVLENGILVCLIVAVCIGNTSYNGESLKTLREQQRLRTEKEHIKEMSLTLESRDREYLNGFIQTLNDTTVATENASNQSFVKEQEINEENLGTSGAPENYLVSSYKSQKQKNNDTVGWIKIDNTQVNYPVMYNADNNYYLKRTPAKTSSVYGSIFLDQQSMGQWGIFNLVHGHNMNNGSMFADIAKMMKKDYFNAHKIIQVYDGNVLKEYTAFCALSIDDRYEGIPVQYSSLKEYHQKIDDYCARAMISEDYPRDCTDFLLLNTCWYGVSGGEKNLHAIIIAYRSK